MRKRSFSTRSWRNISGWKGNERFFSSKDKEKKEEENSSRTSKNYHFVSFPFGRDVKGEKGWKGGEWMVTIALSLLSGWKKKRDGSIGLSDENGGNGSSIRISKVKSNFC